MGHSKVGGGTQSSREWDTDWVAGVHSKVRWVGHSDKGTRKDM